MKKAYETPSLTVYGDVAKITLGGSGGISDLIIGNNNPGSDTDGNGCINIVNGNYQIRDYTLCSYDMGTGH